MWDIRLKESVHLHSADVVLVIPMIPPPFFPVPFIHSMAWSMQDLLGWTCERISLQQNCLFWTLIERILEADASPLDTPDSIVRSSGGHTVWSRATSDWKSRDGVPRCHHAELKCTATVLRPYPYTATSSWSWQHQTYFQQNQPGASWTCPGPKQLSVLESSVSRHQQPSLKDKHDSPRPPLQQMRWGLASGDARGLAESVCVLS